MTTISGNEMRDRLLEQLAAPRDIEKDLEAARERVVQAVLRHRETTLAMANAVDPDDFDAAEKEDGESYDEIVRAGAALAAVMRSMPGPGTPTEEAPHAQR